MRQGLKISILGCGWLGLPLGRQLLKDGHDIKGSTMQRENLGKLRDAGILPYLIKLNPALNADYDPGFFKADVLIINIPPKRREDIIDYHTAQIKNLIKVIKKGGIKKVIFISSTSVYPALNREVTEEDAQNPGKNNGEALLAVENLLTEEDAFNTTVVRFCGLIGYDRKPGNFLAGKKLQSNGANPVNLIHRDDCIGIIEAIIKHGAWGETFNACSDKHPTRREYYEQAARKLGVKIPEFNDDALPAFKIINSEKLKSRLHYSFKFPDPAAIIE